MRVKTSDRRYAIMEAAGEIFRKSGFERTSMAEISEAVGGSKATLYSYFKSKEDLYAAVMLEAVEAQAGKIKVILNQSSGDLRQTLERFGSSYLSFLLSPRVVAVLRNGIAVRDSSLGRAIFERGPQRAWQHVAEFLAHQIHDGRLRPADPTMVAAHLKGLLQAGLFEPYLFGARSEIPRKDAVKNAVEVFLRAYAP